MPKEAKFSVNEVTEPLNMRVGAPAGPLAGVKIVKPISSVKDEV